jgi:AcrR family transcriptional regulator
VRRLLLDAAAEGFASRPYETVGIREIAEAAGVATSVAYRHFGSKADLFREVTVEPLALSLQEFSATWHAQRSAPWEDRPLMRALIADLYRSLGGHRTALVALANAGLVDIEVGTGLRKMLDELFHQLLVIGQEEARRRRWFSEQRLERAIRLVVAMVLGAVTFEPWLFGDGDGDGDGDGGHVVDDATDLILWGLRRQPPESG